ncbi:MAG: DUF72 domain-containing protein [Patescibacteria group bacterium]
MNKTAKTYIGTSGWVYRHWFEVFYPEDTRSDELLQYYAQYFNSVELNASFYRLPKAEVFAGWHKKTPKDFLFSVKASRYITHLKKLRDFEEGWRRFIDSARELKEKLGPILFQLPPFLKADNEVLKKALEVLPKKYKYAFEFRHESWFSPKIYDILKKHNVALVVADSPEFPSKKEITADFAYLRFHGLKSLYGSKYSDEELNAWAKDIQTWSKKGIDVYAYFNNDAEGYAVENAKELNNLLKS